MNKFHPEQVGRENATENGEHDSLGHLVLGCVTDFQVFRVNRLFAITYSVDYAFSSYRFPNFL